MPLYETYCKTCNVYDEQLLGIGEPPDYCSCGSSPRILVSLFAKTPNRWGDTNGGFDVGLGTYVENSVHREQIMKQRGLEILDDATLERGIAAKEKKDEKIKTYNDTYRKLVDDGADGLYAMEQAQTISEGV